MNYLNVFKCYINSLWENYKNEHTNVKLKRINQYGFSLDVMNTLVYSWYGKTMQNYVKICRKSLIVVETVNWSFKESKAVHVINNYQFLKNLSVVKHSLYYFTTLIALKQLIFLRFSKILSRLVDNVFSLIWH